VDAHVPQRTSLAGMSDATSEADRPPAAVPTPEMPVDIRPGLLRRIAARDGRDAGAWREPIRALLGGRRYEEAAAALDAELGPPDSDVEHAGPMAPARRSLVLAHFAELIGDVRAAAELYGGVSSFESTRLPAMLGLGRVLHPLGRTGEAAAALHGVTAMRPESVEAWCNLSALEIALGRPDAALDAAARALELAPDLAAAEVNRGEAFRLLGRFHDAVAAYQRAVTLQPRWPAALNRLAGVLRILRDYERAEARLRAAIAIAPQFGLARINLGTLCIEQGRLAEGSSLLLDALALLDLDNAARTEAESARAQAAEHLRLAPAIASAMAASDPAPIREVLDAERDPTRVPSREALALLAQLADRLDGARADIPSLPVGMTAPAEWPGIEAHFAFHRPASRDAVRQTLETIAAVRASPEIADAQPAALDVFNFDGAVRQRRSLSSGSGSGSEAWLRYWHARITGHRPQMFPGQIKPVPNFVLASHRLVRVTPRQAAATCAEFFATGYVTMAPGFERAALVYFAIAQIHPFYDGNGRVARFLLNAELELASLPPLLFPKAVDEAIPGVLDRVRTSADLMPLMEAIAEAARFTVDFLGRLGDGRGEARGG
jgi:tetratricopeptide (TPR) repeat protein